MYVKKQWIKIFSLLIILAMLIPGLSVSPARAQGNTLTVCASGCDHTTIQAAIDSAQAGDTINVHAGTYNEAILLKKPLSLVGAGAETTFIDGSGLTGSTLFGIAEISSGQVNISGFTFKDDPDPDAPMTYLVSIAQCLEPAEITFDNNILVGTGDTDKDWGLLPQNNTAKIVINNNKFDNIGGNSIMVERSLGPVELGYNEFLVPNDGGPTIWSMSYAGNGNPGTVEGLHWYHDNHIYPRDESIWSGITIAPAWGFYWNERQNGSYENILIENNVIEGYVNAGVHFEVDGLNSTANAVIQNNTLTAYNNQTSSSGVSLLGSVSDTIIRRNDIKNGRWGIVTRGSFGQPFYPTGIKIEKNRLDDNLIGYDEIDPASDQEAFANWWGSSAGPAAGYVVGNNQYNPWCYTEDCTELYVAEGGSIQKAVSEAIEGGVVHVGPGTYPEALVLNKPGITVKSTGGASQTILDVPSGNLTTGVMALKDMGVVTFDGFTVKGFTENGIVQGMSQKSGTTFHVLNNIVVPDNDYLRNGIQVAGDGSAVKGNQVQGQYLTQDWGSTAIGVVNASNVVVQGNTVTGPGNVGIAAYTWGDLTASNIQILENNVSGFDVGLGVEAYSGGSTTGVEIHKNIVKDYQWAIYALPYPDAPYAGLSVSDVDASLNYWGSACGPSLVEGVASFSPWYIDEAMTATAEGEPGNYVFSEGVTKETMNAVIACAPPSTQFTFDGALPGGLVVNQDNLTFNLDGAVIGHGSPAFEIFGKNVTINGPGVLAGDGNSPGILVHGGADNFILDGVEIRDWTDGVELDGDVVSFKIVNNWIHSNSGSALNVAGTPSGVVTIEGNLFKANIGAAVVYGGPDNLDVTYNSWGAVGGPTGLGTNLIYDPWTFSEIYMDVDPTTAGDNYTRHVTSTGEFDVEVRAEAKNLYGLSFTVEYDDAKLELTKTTFDAVWDEFSTEGRCFEKTGLPAGQIGYYCTLYNTDAAWDGGAIAAFTFKPLNSGKAIFDVYSDDSLSSAAVGGVKVWVNNAGYNDPSVTLRDISDDNDGEIDIDISQFTGFVDLEGRPNDSGALISVFDDSLGSNLLATANSASSGAYTTAYQPNQWMTFLQNHYIKVDRSLFLPTYLLTKNLDGSPLTFVQLLKLLGGDATDDDEIDIGDAACIGAAYGTLGGVCGTSGHSDVTSDGIVNLYDLTLMGGNFGLSESPWAP